MKKTRNLMLILLGSFLVLSFATRNNFNPTGKDWLGLESEDMVKAEVVKTLVTEQVITPMYDCYQKVNPHAFMMKCYSAIVFEFENDDYNKDLTLDVYANYPVRGEMIHINCDVRNHICDMRITPSTKLIEVQESYFEPWIKAEDYVKSFCTRLEAKKDQ